MNFAIGPTELNKLADWIDVNNKERLNSGKTLNDGASGGRFTYSFTPTSLGEILKITDNLCKKTLDLTDYDSW